MKKWMCSISKFTDLIRHRNGDIQTFHFSRRLWKMALKKTRDSTESQAHTNHKHNITYYFHEHFSFAGSKQHRLLNLVEKKLSFLCLLRSVNELMLHIHFFMMSIKTNVDKHSLTHWLCVSQWWHHRIVLTSCVSVVGKKRPYFGSLMIKLKRAIVTPKMRYN